MDSELSGICRIRSSILKRWKKRRLLLKSNSFILRAWELSKYPNGISSEQYNLKFALQCNEDIADPCGFSILFKNNTIQKFRAFNEKLKEKWINIISERIKYGCSILINYSNINSNDNTEVLLDIKSINKIAMQTVFNISDSDDFYLLSSDKNPLSILPDNNGKFIVDSGKKYYLKLRNNNSCIVSNNSDNTFIPFEDLHFLSLNLSNSGGGGEIKCAQWFGKLVAVKLIHSTPNSNELFEKEFKYLALLRHPNIIRFFGWSKNEHRQYLVMEWLQLGNLKELILSDDILFDWPLIFSFILDIISGMIYLHKKGIIHRDIKLENIMLDYGTDYDENKSLNENNNKSIVKRVRRCKIIDFGIASKGLSDNATYSGTPGSMAPELYNDGNLTFSADVFAFGLILYSLLINNVHWDNISSRDRQQKLSNFEIPDIPIWVPDSLSELLKQCWDKNPTKRPSFEDIKTKILQIKTYVIENYPSLFILTNDNYEGEEIFATSQISPILGIIKIGIVYHKEQQQLSLSLSIQGTCVFQNNILDLNDITDKENNITDKIHIPILTIDLQKKHILKLLKIGSKTQAIYDFYCDGPPDYASISIEITEFSLILSSENDTNKLLITDMKGGLFLNFKIQFESKQIKFGNISYKTNSVKDYEIKDYNNENSENSLVDLTDNIEKKKEIDNEDNNKEYNILNYNCILKKQKDFSSDYIIMKKPLNSDNIKNIYNITILGSRSSGKSTLFQSFIQSHTCFEYDADFANLYISYCDSPYKFVFWDTKRMSATTVTTSYLRYQNSYMIILLDLEDYDNSIKEVKLLIERITREALTFQQNIIIMLTKTDLVSQDTFNNILLSEEWGKLHDIPSVAGWISLSLLNESHIKNTLDNICDLIFHSVSSKKIILNNKRIAIMNEPLDVIFKILVLGDSNSGKTQIINRYTRDEFEETYKETIGVDFTLKTIKSEQQNYIIRNQMWDISGSIRFTNMGRAYYKEAAGAIIVFDCTSEDNINNVIKWKEEIETKLGNIPLVLFANKIDLGMYHKNDSFMKNFVQKNGFINYFYTSAKIKSGIDEGMKVLVEKMIEDLNFDDSYNSKSDVIKISNNRNSEIQNSTCNC